LQHVIAFSKSAVTVRHWFEINLNDASMEHGARIELRELVVTPHRGSESAAQLICADRPLWRADLFDRLADAPGSFAIAHYHPEFHGNEPCKRAWDPELTANPWHWLRAEITRAGSGPGRDPWPITTEDAADLAGVADQVVEIAQQFAPDRCASASQCYELTRDVEESVQLMIKYLSRPDRLDANWVSPWQSST
jgi:hypothetical protein